MTKVTVTIRVDYFYPLILAYMNCYTLNQGDLLMPQIQIMTLDEKFAISHKAIALKQAGDEEGASRLIRSIPMPPYLAKVYKEKVGVKELIESGWNLSEAEAEFGADWLSK